MVRSGSESYRRERRGSGRQRCKWRLERTLQSRLRRSFSKAVLTARRRRALLLRSLSWTTSPTRMTRMTASSSTTRMRTRMGWAARSASRARRSVSRTGTWRTRMTNRQWTRRRSSLATHTSSSRCSRCCGDKPWGWVKKRTRLWRTVTRRRTRRKRTRTSHRASRGGRRGASATSKRALKRARPRRAPPRRSLKQQPLWRPSSKSAS
mmetsp:Transcript_1629/g.5943  ORF Transcript_1629/g.5943 Transcript_1629/m.5943 type:complete len:208 (-) Transcript_1629:1197-1820(-)